MFYAGVFSCYGYAPVVSLCVPGQPSHPAIPERGEGRGGLLEGAPAEQVSR